jgi:beta-N-acetylhexosaminidase
VRGVQGEGVAAAVKHFPGLGEAALDSHEGLPVLDGDRARLDAVELAPFRAAIVAGAEAVMSAHVAVPALTGDATLPATLAGAVMTDLLRGELGFDGLTITDALDMRALPQGPEQALDAVTALRAGVDLLLLTADDAARARIEVALRHAEARGLLEPATLAQTAERLARLRRRLASVVAPDPSVVGSAFHRQLAHELAGRSVTLVRNDDGLLPLHLAPDSRVLAIMPRPRDLTPADTSSRVTPELGAALRSHHPCVEELVVGHPPTPADIMAAGERAAASDIVVVGTIAASFDSAQVDLVAALQATSVPTITVALRTPFDLAAYPSARTHICTYGILRPSLDALAAGLFGRSGFSGRLPAPIPGLYPVGHGHAA